jgi:hypothetical protein
MVQVRKFQLVGDFPPNNNMFGDWSAIIDTVGSISGSAPPSWWSCDHVSRMDHNGPNEIIFHIVGKYSPE